jgi:hypothetical protein
MFWIKTAKSVEKHQQKPTDIYFSSLEEAYGNLPVPSDDWADIKSIISFNELELEGAIEIIREHYLAVAKALGKQAKYG